MEDRIKKVMAAVFAVSEGEISDDSSPDNLENWDSLRHMNLVVALEEEFNLEFDNDEAVDLMNYTLIKTIISEKLS